MPIPKKLLGDLVLMKEKKPEPSKKAVIAVKSKEEPIAEVILVGPGRKDQPMTVTKGDIVGFVLGNQVEFDGVKYYLVSENNILYIL